jgi:hypothetical protein
MTGDRDGNRSNPYRPNPEHCCEACVFGKGPHSVWCPAGIDLEHARMSDEGCPHDPSIR